MNKIFITSLLLICLNSFIFPQQVAGRIITLSQADSLFGLPDKSVPVDRNMLRDFSSSNSYLFFTISEDQVFITDSHLNVLFPGGYKLKGNELFHIYSSSVLKELIGASDKDIIVELRKEVLTITCGELTLEFGFLCPPYCNAE